MYVPDFMFTFAICRMFFCTTNLSEYFDIGKPWVTYCYSTACFSYFI